ncbi:MAG: hypothetical protein ACI8PB_002289 [Desulforhopalus sp.]|jgi:hypothetical protein
MARRVIQYHWIEDQNKIINTCGQFHLIFGNKTFLEDTDNNHQGGAAETGDDHSI